MIVVLNVIVPLIALGTFTVIISKNLNRESYADYKILTSRKVGSAINYIFQEIDNSSLFLIANNDIVNYFTGVSKNDPEASLQLYRNSLNTLIYLSSNSVYIDSIKIVGPDGRSISCGSMNMQVSEQNIALAKELNGKSYWGCDTIMVGNETRDMFYQCRLLRDPTSLKQDVGTMKIYLNRSAFLKEFFSETNPFTDFYLVDKSGRTVFTTSDTPGAFSAISHDELLKHNRSSLDFSINRQQYVITPYHLSMSDWILYGASSTIPLHMQTWNSVALFLPLLAVCLVVCLSLASIMARRLLNPLNDLIHVMDSIEATGFSERIKNHRNDEIGSLTRQFNLMADRIHALIEQVYRSNLLKREAEMRALQQKINPHVLYNTLDCAYWISKKENAPQTGELLHLLSQFYRLTLRSVNEFSTVEQDIELLKYYIALQQMTRVPFLCEVDVDETTLKCRTIHMALQPIVENALQHGISGLEYGKLTVRVAREGEQLVYTIQDNGHGFDVFEMYRLLAADPVGTRGLGIKNVNDRIQLTYGKSYGLFFANPPEGGGRVRIVLPFIILSDNAVEEESE